MSLDAFTGEIMLWSCRKVPENWVVCDGRELPVRDFQALYSLIGNNYGGVSNQSFKVPDLRGAVPVGVGNLSPYKLGARGGSEKLVFTKAVPLPSHAHVARFEKGEISNGVLANGKIDNGVLANGKVTDATPAKIAVNTANTTFASGVTSPSGNFLGVGLTSTAQTRDYNASPTSGQFLGGVTGGDGSTVTGDVKGDVSGTVTGGVKGVVTLEKTGDTNAQIAFDLDVRQPYLGLAFLICVNGTYPMGDEQIPG